MASIGKLGIASTDCGPTLKFTEAESPLEPVTVTEYKPLPTFATVKDPVTSPPVTEHVEEATASLEIEQDVSLVENPVPDTATFVHGPASDGLSEINKGAVVTTVNTS
jgi:hypothetical protein